MSLLEKAEAASLLPLLEASPKPDLLAMPPAFWYPDPSLEHLGWKRP